MSVGLGDKAKDPVTGFIGVAVAIHEYLHGCRRITLQPKVKKDGELREMGEFDEPQLVVMTARQHAIGDQVHGGPAKYTDKRKKTPLR